VPPPGRARRRPQPVAGRGRGGWARDRPRGPRPL